MMCKKVNNKEHAKGLCARAGFGDNRQKKQFALSIKQNPTKIIIHGKSVESALRIYKTIYIDTSKMPKAKLQFHYFKMPSFDNNNKLDGCELVKSLILRYKR
uniref:Uncharacterized protein n=1 Tax=Glossina palpalis gambiensis TaxID=67801 RepID=A0A1B0B5W3_9MUSC